MFLVQTYLADILFFRKKTSIFSPWVILISLQENLFLSWHKSFMPPCKQLQYSTESVSNKERGILAFYDTLALFFFANKTHLFKVMVFPVIMYGCESWTIKTAEHRRIDAFELWCWRRLLRVPWTARRSNQSKGNQSWVFIGKTDAEAETPILWSPDAKSWLVGKDPDAGKDWGQKKGTTEDEMVGWHHQLDGHEFE